MFKKEFKKNLIAGLLVTIPAGLTYMILSFVITRVDRAMAPAIKGIFGPQGLDLMEEWYVPGMGFLLLGLFIIGVGTVWNKLYRKKNCGFGGKNFSTKSRWFGLFTRASKKLWIPSPWPKLPVSKKWYLSPTPASH